MQYDYKTRDQARASLFENMAVFYNRQRRHSTIRYEAPLNYEGSTNDAVEKANFREKLLCNLLIYSVVILAF